MPHSVTAAAEEESAPPSATQMESEAAAAAGSSPPEEDIVMVEAGEVGGGVEEVKTTADAAPAQPEADADTVEIQQEKKPEINLEDLFAGIDSDDDDEFPSSSNPLNGQGPPSSPG